MTILLKYLKKNDNLDELTNPFMLIAEKDSLICTTPINNLNYVNSTNISDEMQTKIDTWSEIYIVNALIASKLSMRQ